MKMKEVKGVIDKVEKWAIDNGFESYLPLDDIADDIGDAYILGSQEFHIGGCEFLYYKASGKIEDIAFFDYLDRVKKAKEVKLVRDVD